MYNWHNNSEWNAPKEGKLFISWNLPCLSRFFSFSPGLVLSHFCLFCVSSTHSARSNTIADPLSNWEIIHRNYTISVCTSTMRLTTIIVIMLIIALFTLRDNSLKSLNFPFEHHFFCIIHDSYSSFELFHFCCGWFFLLFIYY